MVKKSAKSPKKTTPKKAKSVKMDMTFADPLKLAAKASAAKKIKR
jgi:hypothetical protein